MKIIIAGAGEVGFHLAKLLSYESQEITLLFNGNALSSTYSPMVETTAPTETNLHTYTPADNTAGVLTTFIYSSNSCFRVDGYVKKSDGVVNYSGELVHTFFNPDDHSIDVVPENGNVVFKVTGGSASVNWQCKFDFHSVTVPDPPAVNKALKATFLGGSDMVMNFGGPLIAGQAYESKSMSSPEAMPIVYR